MPNRSSSFDVAVVGAGVIGLAVGWRLAGRGLNVVVLERGAAPAGQTSSVAAGMLAPISETLATELPLMRLGLASVRAYPDFVAELTDATRMDTGYLRCGTLLVARDGDEAEALARELSLRESLGLAARRLRASEARRLEPALAPTLRLALDVLQGSYTFGPIAMDMPMPTMTNNNGFSAGLLFQPALEVRFYF